MAGLDAGYSPLFVRPQNLVFYAPLVREAVDIVGGVALTPTNSPTISVHPPIIYPSSQILQFPPAAAASGGVFDIFSPGIITGAPAL